MQSERFDRLKTIEDLAQELHGSTDAADAYTFKSLRDHVEEVRALVANSNEHWKAETADIIIHALMLLRRRGVRADEIDQLIDVRLGRFKDKISTALADKERKEKFRKNIYGEENSGRG